MWHTILQVRLLLGLLPLLGGVLWLGMDGGGTHYEKSPSEVKAALSAAYLPTHVLGSYVKGSRVSMSGDSTVVTALLDENGAELMRFVTTVTPDGTGSMVDTEVRGPEGVHAKGAEKAMKSQAFTMALMAKLADEHVAAAIEGREFDMMFGNPMAKEMANAVPGMREQIEDANAGAMDMARAEQDDASGAEYSDDWGETETGEASDWAQ